MILDSPVSTIAHLIQLSVAPVFLLTGVGSILTVLTNRLGRIVDRSRALEKNLPAAGDGEHAAIHMELENLSTRAVYINWAISLCVMSALLVCSLIATLFVSDIVKVSRPEFVALLFIAAMLSLIGALLCFMREIYIAIRNLRIGLH